MMNRRQGRRGLLLALTAAALALAGCSDMSYTGGDPVGFLRDMTGLSKDDAQDDTNNSKNLAEGSAEPYPNLASVPNAPDSAMSHIDRDTLAQNLAADRQNAKYTDEQLAAGQPLSAAPPPPPMDEAPTSGSAAGPPPPAPPPAPESAVPPKPQPAVQAAPAPPPKATRANRDTTPKRGSEPPPAESSLRSPTTRAMPRGDTAGLVPPSPEQLASAAPPGGDMGATRRTRSGDPGVSIRVGEVSFTPGPYRARITQADRQQLSEIAGMVKRNGARIHIIGFGGGGAEGDLSEREFQSFGAALDNAKAVAVALSGFGVPANQIEIETSSSINSRDRADIYVEY
jgi:hypothetical protein